MTLPSNEAVRTAVEAGAGVAVLSRLVVARALKAGDLVELPLGCPTAPFTRVAPQGTLSHPRGRRADGPHQGAGRMTADTHSVLSGLRRSAGSIIPAR
jgi:DNA-binding transcriptional LysR family regulator